MTRKPRKGLIAEYTELMNKTCTPAEKRRLAEVVELVYGTRSSVFWWQEAADAGDPDAIDYLPELLHDLEQEEGTP